MSGPLPRQSTFQQYQAHAHWSVVSTDQGGPDALGEKGGLDGLDDQMYTIRMQCM